MGIVGLYAGKSAELEKYRETIEARAAAGLSAKIIAQEFGVTRNIIIGYCNRRGIKLGYKQWPVRLPKPKPKAAKKSTSLGGWVVGLPSVVPDASMPEDLQKLTGPKFPQPWEGVGVPFTDGAGYCQRPLWGPEVSTGNVCGNKVEGRSRYCPSCHRVMWTTPPKKPKKNGPLTNTRYQSYKHVDFA